MRFLLHQKLLRTNMHERHLLLMCMILMFTGQIIILFIFGYGDNTRTKVTDKDREGRYIYVSDNDAHKLEKVLNTIHSQNDTKAQDLKRIIRGLYVDKQLPTLESRTITGLTESKHYKAELSLRNKVTRTDSSFTNILKECSQDPKELRGRETVRIIIPGMGYLESFYKDVTNGGHWKPTCLATNRIALILPLCGEWKYFQIFLFNTIQKLKRQLADFTIYIVEPDSHTKCNIGLMRNIGFSEASKHSQYDCYIFHNVATIVENDRNLFICHQGAALHMSVSVDIYNYKSLHKTKISGIQTFDASLYRFINGNSNLYFDPGPEDDDLYNRLLKKDVTILRPAEDVSTVAMLRLDKATTQDSRKKVEEIGQFHSKDGLNSLKYDITIFERKKLFTRLVFRADEYYYTAMLSKYKGEFKNSSQSQKGIKEVKEAQIKLIDLESRGKQELKRKEDKRWKKAEDTGESRSFRENKKIVMKTPGQMQDHIIPTNSSEHEIVNSTFQGWKHFQNHQTLNKTDKVLVEKPSEISAGNKINENAQNGIFNSLGKFIIQHVFGMSKAKPKPKRRNLNFTVAYNSCVIANKSKGNNNAPRSIGASVSSACPFCSPFLIGKQTVKKTAQTMRFLERYFSNVVAGHWSPSFCNASLRVAIIIPYRNRDVHLRVLLYNLIPKLQRQLVDFTIYVIEQGFGSPFNRGLMRNVGYLTASKEKDFDCYIFNDVDTVIEDDRNLYTCVNGSALHMAAAVDVFGYELKYLGLVGGILSVTGEDFERINGYSNIFFMWGGEDDSLTNRLNLANITIVRPKEAISRITTLYHIKDQRDKSRFQLVSEATHFAKKDGLKSVKYNHITIMRKQLYTLVHVSIDQSYYKSLLDEWRKSLPPPVKKKRRKNKQDLKPNEGNITLTYNITDDENKENVTHTN